MLLAEIVQRARYIPCSLLLIMMITKYLLDLLHEPKAGIRLEYFNAFHDNVLF